MRLRSNFAQGTLDNALAADHSSFSDDEFTGLPEITADSYDYAVVTLDPLGAGNGPEIVYITEHASGATPVNKMIRGREGTSIVAHDAGTAWVHGPTKLDFDLGYKHPINFPKHTPDVDDDDFDSSSLDAKWTVVDGTIGTVDPTQGTTVADGIIDPSSLDRGLLIQPGDQNEHCHIRQQITLADGEVIVARQTYNAFLPVNNNTHQIRWGLSDSSTILEGATNHAFLYWETDEDTYDFYAVIQGSSFLDNPVGGPPSKDYYSAVGRDGNDFYALARMGDGEGWMSMGRATSAGLASANPLYLHFIWNVDSAPAQSNLPIYHLDWVRKGTGTLPNFW